MSSPPSPPQVESLTAARKAAVSGSEPSDAVRVVNAVLTAIDSFRTHKNVLLLTTSNVSEAIDVAFIDRADVKALVGPPGTVARYDILASCVAELARVGLVAYAPGARGGLTPSRVAKMAAAAALPDSEGASVGASAGAGAGASAGACASAAAADLKGDAPSYDTLASVMLWRAAVAAKGFSGRALRKLPLAAHALHARAVGSGGFGVGAGTGAGAGVSATLSSSSLSVLDFCGALVAAVDSEKEARAGL